VGVIVPGRRALASLLGPASQDLRKKLAEKVTIELAIDNAPLIDVVSFIRDQYEVACIIDDVAFSQGDAKRSVLYLPLSVAAGQWTLKQLFDEVAGKVGGKAEACGSLVLIGPKPKH